MVAMSKPYLDPKSGMYKLRRGVPSALRPIIGKREYWESLGTKDLKEAKRLFPDALAECERVFEAARAELESRSYKISDREAQALAGDWLKSKLALDHDVPSEDEINAALSVIQDQIEAGKWDRWSPLAQETAKARNLPILPNSDSYKALCEALAWVEVRYWNIQAKRDLGDWRDAGLDRYPAFKAQDSGIKLIDLYERLAKEEQPDTRRASDFNRNIERFIDLNEDLPIERITPEHVRLWKDQMVDQGLAPATTNKRLSVLSSLLTYGATNRLIPENPAKGIRAKASKQPQNPRQSFSPDDLKLILSGPVHGQGERPSGGKGEASYWLPMISLYCGARLAEIAQLTSDDIGESNGVPFFDINWNDGKKTKNQNSIRKVPIHHRLIDLGFLKYVEGKDGLLFPGLEESKNGQIAKAWGQWFGRYKKDLGITGKKDFHSFRHTFIDASREASIDSELRKKITGHAPQDVGGGYGTSDLLKRLKVEIDKVDYGDVL